MTREPFQRRCVVEQLTVPLIVLILRADFGDLFDRLLHGVRVVRRIRDQFRERVGLGRREAEHAADVLDGGAAFHRPERHDLTDTFLAVFLSDVVDDFAASLEAEVNVDVGHRNAFRIEEAFEEQIEFQRADVGDFQRVRDQRTGGGAAARADGDPAIARGLDEVMRDQEIAGVPGSRDHIEFVGQPLADLRRERIAVALSGTLFGQLHEQIVLIRDAVRQRERGEEVLLFEVKIRLVRDLQRIFKHIGAIGEPGTHFVGGLEVQAAIVVHPI